jgi:hypothetical protein
MWSITNSAGHFRLATSLRKGMRISLGFLSAGAYPGISCETLEASPSFPRSEIVGAIPSLHCGSAFESDMHVYSASTIYDDLWSYCDTRYKIAA